MYRYMLIIMLSLSSLFAMDEALFDSLYRKIEANQTTEVEEFLSQKYKTYKEDSEYYVLLLNYLIKKNVQRKPIIVQGNPAEYQVPLTDSTGKIVGYIGEKTIIADPGTVQQSLIQTKEALQYFPDRLDIYFGLVTVSKMTENWDIAGQTLVQMLKHSKKNNNKWVWGPLNTMNGSPQKFMIDNIVSHCAGLFRAEKPKADSAFISISQALITYYPEHIYGYANLGTFYTVQKKYTKAEEYYAKALTIDSTDTVVKANLEMLQNMKEK